MYHFIPALWIKLWYHTGVSFLAWRQVQTGCSVMLRVALRCFLNHPPQDFSGLSMFLFCPNKEIVQAHQCVVAAVGASLASSTANLAGTYPSGLETIRGTRYIHSFRKNSIQHLKCIFACRNGKSQRYSGGIPQLFSGRGAPFIDAVEPCSRSLLEPTWQRWPSMSPGIWTSDQMYSNILFSQSNRTDLGPERQVGVFSFPPPATQCCCDNCHTMLWW